MSRRLCVNVGRSTFTACYAPSGIQISRATLLHCDRRGNISARSLTIGVAQRVMLRCVQDPPARIVHIDPRVGDIGKGCAAAAGETHMAPHLPLCCSSRGFDLLKRQLPLIELARCAAPRRDRHRDAPDRRRRPGRRRRATPGVRRHRPLARPRPAAAGDPGPPARCPLRRRGLPRQHRRLLQHAEQLSARRPADQARAADHAQPDLQDRRRAARPPRLRHRPARPFPRRRRRRRRTDAGRHVRRRTHPHRRRGPRPPAGDVRPRGRVVR